MKNQRKCSFRTAIAATAFGTLLVGVAGCSVSQVASTPVVTGSQLSPTATNSPSPTATACQNAPAGIASPNASIPPTTIANFTQVAKGLSDDQRRVIEQTLTAILLSNGSCVGQPVADAVIRDGTYEHGADKEANAYQTFFLIDVPSLKQTYQVDFWAPANSRPKLGDGLTLVECPDPSQLIYGPFKCESLPASWG